MPGESLDDTKFTSVATAAIGNGVVTPFEGQPLTALGALAGTNGFSDDFTNYKGPVAAGSADGYTVAVNATGALSVDVTNENGAGVLDYALPAVADAVSLETERALVELGSKCVKYVTKVQPNNMTDSDIHVGLGSVGVTHGNADSDDMVEVKWDAANAVVELRTQKDGGGVTTTAASAAVSARVAANTGALLVGVVAQMDGTVAGVVSTNNGQVWDLVGVVDAGDASLPIAGDPLGFYVAGVGVVAAADIDFDYWSYMVNR